MKKILRFILSFFDNKSIIDVDDLTKGVIVMSREDILRKTGVAKGKYMMENQTTVKDIRVKKVEDDEITFRVLPNKTNEYEDYTYKIEC